MLNRASKHAHILILDEHDGCADYIFKRLECRGLNVDEYFQPVEELVGHSDMLTKQAEEAAKERERHKDDQR